MGMALLYFIIVYCLALKGNKSSRLLNSPKKDSKRGNIDKNKE